MHASPPPLILASQSPRRRELLTQLGVTFDVEVAGVEERREPQEAPADYVQRLARHKAGAVADRRPGRWVLGADTVVVHAGAILEKPGSDAEALVMLGQLSASTHAVLTAVALQCDGECAEVLVQSTVTFKPIEPALAQVYVATGEGADKAGGYAIQGFGAAFVAHLEGSYSGVVGLPLAETAQLLSAAAIPIWQRANPHE